MVCLSRAAHQPSPERAMTNPPHLSSSVNSGGTSSSPRIITSNLQQFALHEAHVMAASMASGAFGSAYISFTMEKLRGASWILRISTQWDLKPYVLAQYAC
jgi:hypothetical protein